MNRPWSTPRARRRGLHAAATVGMVTLLGAIALAAVDEHVESIAEAESRFEQRIELAGSYVQAHVDDMAERQRNYAELQLAGPVTPERFDTAVLSFGFKAAVLLDGAGRSMAISPQKPSMIGTDLGGDYAHLATALTGRIGVSGVVLSAAKQEPIVAVAVPFETPQGSRVISGGYDLSFSPLRTFLTNTTSIEGRQLYLVDQTNRVIAATEVVPTGSLERHAPEFISPTARTTVDRDGEEHLVVTTPVGRTSWRLVAAVPTDALNAPVKDRTTWALLALAVTMTFAVLALLRRASRQRDLLETLSRTDALTGLMNRREAERFLTQAMARSARMARPCAVAMVDIDHFKYVNDEYGHAVGDQVLCRVARLLSTGTRDIDAVARWGGEEFLVIMEGADAAAAAAIADRLVSTVAQAPSTDGPEATVSVGTAAATDVDGSLLVRRADEALYAAKAAGRNQSAAAVPDPRTDPVTA